MGDLLVAAEVFLLSLLPSFEGRYAILYGVALGLEPLTSLALATAGVATLSLALPYLLPYIDSLMEALSRSSYKSVSRVAAAYLRYVGGVRSRVSRYVSRWGYLGLAIFVAIPLPGTGVWTGSIAAYVLGMERRKSLLALIAGGLASNIITFIPAYVASAAG